MKKRILVLFMIMTCFLLGCRGENVSETEDTNYLTGLHHVVLEIKNYGTIELELDADKAPATVTNFIELCNKDFYNGLTFHRVIDGFMMQGGKHTDQTVINGLKKIKGEFSANGFNNEIKHVRGTISMARSSEYNSASSQFFIIQKDNSSLDGQYAAFGHVTSGMEIVDKICSDSIGKTNDNGEIKDIRNQAVITSIKVID